MSRDGNWGWRRDTVGLTRHGHGPPARPQRATNRGGLTVLRGAESRFCIPRVRCHGRQLLIGSNTICSFSTVAEQPKPSGASPGSLCLFQMFFAAVAGKAIDLPSLDLPCTVR